MKTLTTILFLLMTVSFTARKDVEIVLLLQNDDDVVFVESVYTTLMAAENAAKTLNVDVVMDDVNSNVLIFSVHTEEDAELAIKLFDEEGFEVHAHTKTTLQTGKNYKALNVRTLEDGEYIFELSNSEGATITKKIKIENQ